MVCKFSDICKLKKEKELFLKYRRPSAFIRSNTIFIIREYMYNLYIVYILNEIKLVNRV